MDKVRIDKWLWSVRIFKSRTIASAACKAGRVKIDQTLAKPSDKVAPGQMVYVKKEGFNLEFRVLQLIEKRVGAPLAQTCYENLTPEEELNKFSDWFIGKAGNPKREKGAGRPTKRERREIDAWKNWHFDFDE